MLKFQNFWDQFEAAVHNNVDLPNVQKFTYLRLVLTGNALKAIDGFEVTVPRNHKHFSRICRHPKCSVANCGHRHHWLLHGQWSVAAPKLV